MSLKSARSEKLVLIKSHISLLKKNTEEQNPSPRKINRNLKTIHTTVEQFRALHTKYVMQERNAEEKEMAITEFNEVSSEMDDVITAAQDIRDTLQSAEDRIHQPNAQHKEQLSQERLTKCTKVQDQG